MFFEKKLVGNRHPKSKTGAQVDEENWNLERGLRYDPIHWRKGCHIFK